MSRFIALSVTCGLALFVATLCSAQSPFLANPSMDPLGAIDHQTGAIDIDKLRQEVMSSVPMAGGIAPVELSNRPPLGVKCMPVPDTLRPAHRSLAAAGLLILDVMPGSPADQAGIQEGMVIVRINTRLMKRLSDLPVVDETLEVVVLTVDGLRTATIESDDDQPALPMLGRSQESVSVSNNNGQIRIDAVLGTPNGPKQVRLSGTRAEVDAQISQLSPELARQIRSRVGY